MVRFSKAERSPRSLPDAVIWTPFAPPAMTCRIVHMTARRNAVPRFMCEATLLHMTVGESSGFVFSLTDMRGSL